MKTGTLQQMSIAAVAALSFAGAAQAWCAPAPEPAAAVWSTDWEAARAQARQEGKAVLIFFTGSDWCHYCMTLGKEVLAKPAFAAYAADKFVLVEADLPNRAIAPALRARNEALCERYHIESFPTMLVTTPEGKVLGGFAGGGMGLETVQAYLDVAYANLPKVEAAQALQGVARAQALMEIYASLDDDLRPCAAADKQEIRDNDPDDTCGFAQEEAAAQQMDAFMAEQNTAGADYRRRLTIVEAQLEQALPANKPSLLVLQSGLIAYGAETEDDILAAKSKMLEAADLTTNQPEAVRLRDLAGQRYGNPAAALRQIQNLRARNGVR